MCSLTSLQQYLRFHARQPCEVVCSPPFTLFFHPTNARSWANYALPDASGPGDLLQGLAVLPRLFTQRDRTPSLRFLEEGFPHFPPVLRSCGWAEVERPQVMICIRETFRPAPDVMGLAITTLSPQSPLEEICEGLDTSALGFDPQAERATLQEAEEFRHDLLHTQAFTARLQHQPVGAGRLTEVHEGVAELVGITTLSPFRRQGIAAAVTASMTQEAFRQGATCVFLLAGNVQAGRVYERVGFRPAATLLVYEWSVSLQAVTDESVWRSRC
jgi:RimJ/RimL family protein N-acetyltransferase